MRNGGRGRLRPAGLGLGLCLAALVGVPRTAAANTPTVPRPDVAAAPAPGTALLPGGETAAVRRWILDRDDHAQRPFAIVDKKAARLFVFRADGTLAGATPVLLGAAPGDRAIASRVGPSKDDVARLPLAHRITPAGRFATEPGRNLDGEAIVWFDYDASLAIHRVRPGAARAQRMDRLASPATADHRVSFGCVVVPPAFFDAVVAPTLGAQPGVVYVLPETQPASAMFGADVTASRRHPAQP